MNIQSIKLAVILWLLCFGNLDAFSQKKKKEKADTQFGYHLRGEKQKYTKIPFEFHANLIVLKVKVDDSDTLNFILDTGVSSTILTDESVARKLNFQYARKVKVSGAGEGVPLMANVSVGHTLRLYDVVAHKQNLVVLDQDILKLSEFLGIPIHGIFGHDLFNSFVVSIDFENKKIYITNPSAFKYRKSMGERYPIVVTQSKPYTEAVSLGEASKEAKPIRLVIDTGAGHALLLNADKAHDISLPDKVIRANLGRGLNGEINGHIGRVDKIRMGSIEMDNILASFPDSLSFSMKFPPDSISRQGSIGCELLRRFVVTFNYQAGYIALKPIRMRMKEAFEHDMSGLEVRAKGKEFKEYVIDKVIEDSPAQEAGLEAGDELIFVDNQNVKDLSMSDIYKIFSKKEGKVIDLMIRRKGFLSFTSLKLRRAI